MAGSEPRLDTSPSIAAASTPIPAEDGEARCSLGGANSVEITWDLLLKEDPDTLIVSCCGFNLQRNVADAQRVLLQHPVARNLRAVTSGAFAMLGNLRAGQQCRIFQEIFQEFILVVVRLSLLACPMGPA